jgi:hypothetical protein
MADQKVSILITLVNCGLPHRGSASEGTRKSQECKVQGMKNGPNITRWELLNLSAVHLKSTLAYKVLKSDDNCVY